MRAEAPASLSGLSPSQRLELTFELCLQTIVVHSESPDDIEVVYLVFNAAILAGGIGLNRLGARLRERRAAKGYVVAETP